jgi:hypothetical protein
MGQAPTLRFVWLLNGVFVVLGFLEVTCLQAFVRSPLVHFPWQDVTEVLELICDLDPPEVETLSFFLFLGETEHDRDLD